VNEWFIWTFSSGMSKRGQTQGFFVPNMLLPMARGRARAFLKYSSQDLPGALGKLTEDDWQMVAGK
jgi:hypothetical protein